MGLPLPLTWQEPAAANGLPRPPRLAVFVDWDGTGWTRTSHAGLLALPSQVWAPPAIDVVRPLSLEFSRGVRADFGGDMTGAASLVLANHDDAYTPDRNWCDNPSFETGLRGWSPGTWAGYSDNRVASLRTVIGDAASGSACLEADFTGTGSDAAFVFAFPWKFRAGVTYSLRFAIRRASGSGSLQWGIGSRATTSDRSQTWGQTVGASWEVRTLTWTPAADRSDVVLWIASWGTTTGTVRLDAVGVNPGSVPNAFIEAPTRGMLVPGRRVLVRSAWGSGVFPHFFGRIQRITPEPLTRTVTILCHDQAQALAERSVAIAVGSTTHRAYRLAALDEFERGGLNILVNPSAEADLVGIGTEGPTATLARTSGGAVDGSWSVSVSTATGGDGVTFRSRGLALIRAGQEFTGSLYARSVSGITTWALLLRADGVAGSGSVWIPVTLTASWQRFAVTWRAGTATMANDPGWGGGLPTLSLTQMGAGSGTILVDAAMISPGPELWPWTEMGAGRPANLLTGDEGEFEFSPPSAPSWRAPWSNLVPNPSFEDGSTRGWSVTNGVISNSGDRAAFGGRSLFVDPNPGATATATLTVAGSFLAGQTYRLVAHVFQSGSDGAGIRLGDGAAVPAGAAGRWQAPIASWTPASTVTSVVIGLSVVDGGTGGVAWFDGLMLTATAGTWPDYQETFTGGLTAGGCAVSQVAGGHSGARCMQLAAPAVAGAAIAYNVTGTGMIFWAGRPYTVSFWTRLVSGTTDWRVAIGQNGVDELAVDFAPGPVWRRVAFTWTPRVTHDVRTGASTTPQAGMALAFGTPSGSGAATILLDAIRIEPSGAAGAAEPAGWMLDPAESDLALAVTSSAAPGAYKPVTTLLSELNAATLARQALLPVTDWPYWAYRSVARSTSAAARPIETIAEDLADINGLERDAASVINVQTVWSAESTHGPTVVSDDASIAIFGPRTGAEINRRDLVASQAQALDIGRAVLARHRHGVARPTLTVVNRFPSQLSREVGDVLAVTMARGQVAGWFVILAVRTTVSEAGQRWETAYTLEELA